MSNNSLVLIPVNPHARFNLERLAHSLTQVGLLGEAFSQDRSEYRGRVLRQIWFKSGEHFLDLITFNSSHPIGTLEWVEGEWRESEIMDSRDHCQIILEFMPQVEFLGNALTESPACPACGREIPDWSDWVGRWYDNQPATVWQCPECNTSSQLEQLDWHHLAGFASCALYIYGVSRDEAEPSDKLFEFLETMTGEVWTYFYYRV